MQSILHRLKSLARTASFSSFKIYLRGDKALVRTVEKMLTEINKLGGAQTRTHLPKLSQQPCFIQTVQGSQHSQGCLGMCTTLQHINKTMVSYQGLVIVMSWGREACLVLMHAFNSVVRPKDREQFFTTSAGFIEHKRL